MTRELPPGQTSFMYQAAELARKLDQVLDGNTGSVALVALALLLAEQIKSEGDYPRPALITELDFLIVAMVATAPKLQ